MQRPTTDTVAVADALRPVLLRVGRELRREARAVGISPEQVSLLVAIKYTPGIGIRDLAEHERISAPALTKHVDRLERNGLVRRTPNPDDGRPTGLRWASATSAATLLPPTSTPTYRERFATG
jgi:DNA-binding transcriptional ArsR family regulator